MAGLGTPVSSLFIETSVCVFVVVVVVVCVCVWGGGGGGGGGVWWTLICCLSLKSPHLTTLVK